MMSNYPKTSEELAAIKLKTKRKKNETCKIPLSQAYCSLLLSNATYIISQDCQETVIHFLPLT